MFHQSIVASVLFYTEACWGCAIRSGKTNHLNRLIRKARFIRGLTLDPLEAVIREEDVSEIEQYYEQFCPSAAGGAILEHI